MRTCFSTARLCARLALAALIAGTALPAVAQNATPACTTGPVVSLRVPKAAEALATKRALTIVAIGSSSTTGVGASSSARTYPGVLEALLKQRFPSADIRVINRGGNGEDVPENLARFERDVRDQKPDLVLWQVGTNYIIRGAGLASFGPQLRQGIDLIRDWGADTVVIDLQYSPWVNGNANTPGINALIASTARGANASVFPRYALMKGWAEQQKVPTSQMLIFDGLHMTDWSYDCFAKSLAASLIPALGARARTN
ncbi:SGNH/GDSL hydrolase family protein [Aquabacter sp. CN5-332]|uniref:SGNH/GDSL hydrolase family protein n=1 Tax=Aquabacter sp. CN5-332 TaxID=3156608 RepID=UPI0032B4F5BC